MPKMPNIYKGDLYGHITLTGNSKRVGDRAVVYVEGTCICGKVKYFIFHKLVHGRSKSCGCKRLESRNPTVVTHCATTLLAIKLGHKKIYMAHYNMLRRCYNPTSHRYKNYGGRGIKVCELWKNNFKEFYEWALRSGWEKGLTIERIRVNDDYSPENCIWMESELQTANTTRNIKISAFGETKCLSLWSRDNRCLVNKDTVISRIRKGVSPEVALAHRNRIHKKSILNGSII